MASSILRFLTEIVQPALKELFRRGDVKLEIQAFAFEKGFEYKRQIDPAELDLYQTSFFGPFDVARDAVAGVIDHVRFSYFEHDRASGRGENALVRSVVAFEIGTETKLKDWSPRLASGHWRLEKSGPRVFLWCWSEKVPKVVQEIEGFVRTALEVYRSLVF